MPAGINANGYRFENGNYYDADGNCVARGVRENESLAENRNDATDLLDRLGLTEIWSMNQTMPVSLPGWEPISEVGHIWICEVNECYDTPAPNSHFSSATWRYVGDDEVDIEYRCDRHYQTLLSWQQEVRTLDTVFGSINGFGD